MWPTRMAKATVRISGNTQGAVNTARKRSDQYLLDKT